MTISEPAAKYGYPACPHCTPETYCSQCWAAIKFSDDCETCGLPYLPIREHWRDQGWLVAVYICEEGHEWQTGWDPKYRRYLGMAE